MIRTQKEHWSMERRQKMSWRCAFVSLHLLLLHGAFGMPDVHECVHDTHVLPLVLERQKTELRMSLISDEGQQARRELLASKSVPAPIRMVPVYQLDGLNITSSAFLTSSLVPAATRFLQRMITLSTPQVNGPLKLQGTCAASATWTNVTATYYECLQWASLTCLEATLDPSHLGAYSTCSGKAYGDCNVTQAGSGVPNADYILYVTAKNSSICQGNTLAYASHCSQDDVTDRPTAGSANFCPGHIDPLNNWDLQLATAVHELTHALGFSSALFPYFRSPSGVPLVARNAQGIPLPNADVSNVTKAFFERGGNVTKIVSPKTLQVARQQFGCDTLNGAELEDNGGLGTAGSHWELRIFNGELMTGRSSHQPAYSWMTAAVLEDSGWYIPTYALTNPLIWGRNKGCDFALASCNPKGLPAAFSGAFCNGAFRNGTYDNSTGIVQTVTLDKTCTLDSSSIGYCDTCPVSNSTCYADGCQIISSYSDLRCNDPALATPYSASSSAGQDAAFSGRFFAPDSRCIPDGNETWTLNSKARPPFGGGCFRRRCEWDPISGQAKLFIMIGDKEIQCIDNALVSLTSLGFKSGQIGPCPIANDLCTFAGCPDECTYKGMCNNGACYCYLGWAGDNCSQMQCTASSCPPDQTCDSLSGVCVRPKQFPSLSPFPSWSPMGSFSPSSSLSPSESISGPSPSASVAPKPSPSASNLTLAVPVLVAGTIVDGYMANCTVCLDVNNNRLCDKDEQTAFSDENGQFSFGLVYKTGPIILSLLNALCLDTYTSLPPTSIMSAPRGSSIVSPLTTLVLEVMDLGLVTRIQAEELVKEALGLLESVEISQEDPIDGVIKGKNGAKGLLWAVAQLNNVASQAGALLCAVPDLNSPIPTHICSRAAFKALATAVLSGTEISKGLAAILNANITPTAVSAPPLAPPFGPLLNLTDSAKIQITIAQSVISLKELSKVSDSYTVPESVAAAVARAAAALNALAVAGKDDSPEGIIRWMSAVGFTARAPFLSAVRNLAAGNISTLTFAAGTAPPVLNQLVSSAQLPNFTLASARAPDSSFTLTPIEPPTPPTNSSNSLFTQIAGSTKGYLIGGLFTGAFIVIVSSLIGLIVSRRKRPQVAEGDETMDPNIAQKEAIIEHVNPAFNRGGGTLSSQKKGRRQRKGGQRGGQTTSSEIDSEGIPKALRRAATMRGLRESFQEEDFDLPQGGPLSRPSLGGAESQPAEPNRSGRATETVAEPRDTVEMGRQSPRDLPDEFNSSPGRSPRPSEDEAPSVETLGTLGQPRSNPPYRASGIGRNRLQEPTRVRSRLSLTSEGAETEEESPGCNPDKEKLKEDAKARAKVLESSASVKQATAAVLQARAAKLQPQKPTTPTQVRISVKTSAVGSPFVLESPQSSREPSPVKERAQKTKMMVERRRESAPSAPLSIEDVKLQKSVKQSSKKVTSEARPITEGISEPRQPADLREKTSQEIAAFKLASMHMSKGSTNDESLQKAPESTSKRRPTASKASSNHKRQSSDAPKLGQQDSLVVRSSDKPRPALGANSSPKRQASDASHSGPSTPRTSSLPRGSGSPLKSAVAPPASTVKLQRIGTGVRSPEKGRPPVLTTTVTFKSLKESGPKPGTSPSRSDT